MRFVLDASVTMSWCFEDETTNESQRILKLFFQNEAIVPAIWPFEVGNAMLTALRTKRLKAAEGAKFFALLATFPIEVESCLLPEVAGRLMPLASQHGLSCYDAAYVELALRERLPIATIDRRVKQSARTLGLKCL